jgi:hypothetical protein
VRTTICSCGSGRPFDRCHGDPANDFARAQALAEARQLAVLFPSVRLRDTRVLEFAARAAAELADVDVFPDEMIVEGFELVPKRERRELVAGWVAVYPDRWRSLSRAAGDTAAAEREVVKGAVEVVIAERQPTPRPLLEQVETERLRPAMALAILLPPQFIWSLDEAHVAETAARGRGPADAIRALNEITAAIGGEVHVDRVRSLAVLLAAELPLTGLRRASRVLAEAVTRVADDSLFARQILALTLAGYVVELPGEYSTSLN